VNDGRAVPNAICIDFFLHLPEESTRGMQKVSLVNQKDIDHPNRSDAPVEMLVASAPKSHGDRVDAPCPDGLSLR
jgi:hypothetical protein